MPGLAPLAAAQLAAWEALAADWPLSRDDTVWRCVACGKGVALAADSEHRDYQYTPDQWQAQIVLHLRNHHPDLDPDKPL